MIYSSDDMEARAVLATAQRMCAAARTAPKAKGVDNLVTLVLTGEDKDRLADEMERLSEPLNYAFFLRDAGTMREFMLFALTAPRICCSPRCARCWAITCIRRALWSSRTGCASTSRISPP